MSEYDEVVEERDGYRALIIHDDDSLPPDYCGGLVFRVWRGNWGAEVDQVSHQNCSCSDPQADLIEKALVHFTANSSDPLETLVRWMRIFLEREEADYKLYETGRGLAYVSVSWDSEVGLVEPDGMTDWIAYSEGDVWGVRVERAITTRTTRTMISADGTETVLYDSGSVVEWDEEETTWGFYGHEYAEEEALSALEDYATRD